MNKSKISKLLLAFAPGLQTSSNAFFRTAFDHVLDGIHLEYVPGGIYLWHFIFPLYDNFGFNLLYSERMVGESGYISTVGKSDHQIANDVSSSAAKNFLAGQSNPLGISDFIKHLERSTALLRNPHVRMTYASSLMLNKQEELALESLQLAGAGLKGRDVNDFKVLVEAFSRGRPSVILVLNEIQKRVFGELKIDGTVTPLR